MNVKKPKILLHDIKRLPDSDKYYQVVRHLKVNVELEVVLEYETSTSGG